jgi:hypothetical protein
MRKRNTLALQAERSSNSVNVLHVAGLFYVLFDSMKRTRLAASRPVTGNKTMSEHFVAVATKQCANGC